ncbi:MAG: hypothetical protein HFG99_12580 [Dorea sp.]|jgi:RNA polymerase sigma factor (sigma-70 family)|nr:hypothetical protein [Dorea sp.]MCI9249941.1 hypothetical protein [Dorea sp.]
MANETAKIGDYGQLTLTKEQVVFYLRKKKLETFKEKRASGQALTYEEEQYEDKIKADLFASVLKFGMKEAKQILVRYRVDSDAWKDIQQGLAEKFYEKLDSYDPLRSTPTTFYVRHFREVISTYLSKNTLHLSPYDIKNSRKVIAAIQHYESKGIQWTDDMVATRTGLSPKVVRSTLQYRYNTNYVAVDDDESCTQIVSKIPNPEDMMLAQEREEVISRAVIEVLEPEEWDILKRRINLDGHKEKSFENIHLETGIPLKEVKSIYNRAIVKLGSSKDIQRLFNKTHIKRQKAGNVVFQEDTSRILHNQIFAQD